METYHEKEVLVIRILVVCLFLAGCGQPSKKALKEIQPEADLGTMVGSLVEVFAFDEVPVEGYGLAGGLNGTGSSECPTPIRKYLTQYILKQLPGQDVEKLISDMNTAVVYVEGLMPAGTLKNQYFDVKIAAVPGTQTTSLEGGWLYRTELKAKGGFGITLKILGYAEGPVFIDTLDTTVPNKNQGYVLAGGTSLEEYKINLMLRQPDFVMASSIRNLLNGRFGPDTAKAVSPSQVDLKVPDKYLGQKHRFISIVKEMYLRKSPKVTQERINNFVIKLAVSKEEKEESEIALEAIGNESLGKLSSLLNSSIEEVRLRAGRCMLNLGSDEGLDALRRIALDTKSTYRIEALDAITRGASRNDAEVIGRRLLRDEDFDIRLAAYEQLRKLDDIAISQKLIARSFYLEQIVQTEHQSIFVSRSGQPRIVLFGSPIYCRDNIFIQSSDGSVIINAPAGQKYVSIIRQHPMRPNAAPIQLRSSFDLGEIIQVLCGEPVKKTEEERIGLGVGYGEAISLLKQMSERGAVRAEFRAGPMPKIDLNVKK